jgi:HEAT repeat protein
MLAASRFRIAFVIVALVSVLELSASQQQPKNTSQSGEKSSASQTSQDAEPQPSAQQNPEIPNPALPPLDEAWQVLDAGISSDKPGDRALAVRALGLLGDDTKALKLAEKELADPKPQVRSAAAEALGQMESRRSIPKLEKMLDDSDPDVVLAAAHALIRLNDEPGYEVYYEILTGERKAGKGLVASETAILKDPKRMVDLGFHEGLGFVPFGSISWQALKMITKDDVSPVRAAAARLLAKDPDPGTTKALIKAAGDKSWLVRAAALEALARRGDPSAVQTAVLYLYDDKSEVKYTAATAVIRLSARKRKHDSEPKE